MNPYAKQGQIYHPSQPPYDGAPANSLWAVAEKKNLWHMGNGIGLAILGMLAVSTLIGLGMVFFGSLFGFYNLKGEFVGPDVAEQLVTLISYIPMLIVPFVIYAKAKRIRLSDVAVLSKPRKGLMTPGIFVGLGCCILGNILVMVLSMLMAMLGIEITTPAMSVPTTLAGQGIYLLTVGILPAFIEEFVFRGIVMQPLRRYGDGFAIVMSAIVFGLVHGNLVQIPFAMVVGLIIGFFVVKSNSLWVGIVIHLINNTASVVLTMLLSGVSDVLGNLVVLAYYGILILLAIVFLAVLIDRQRWIFRKNPVRSPLSLGKRVSAFLLNPGMILAFLAMVYMTSFYVKFVGRW